MTEHVDVPGASGGDIYGKMKGVPVLKTLLSFLAAFFWFSTAVFAGASVSTAMDQGKDGDFRAIALLTSNPNWAREWQSPKRGGPGFLVSDTVLAGDPVWFVVLISPGGKVGDRVDVSCDVEVFENSRRMNRSSRLKCFEGSIESQPEAFRLTKLVLKIGTENAGRIDETKLSLKVVVTEQVRARSVPLAVSTVITSREEG